MITDSTKVLQVLYSGLGGHGSVVTSLIMADKKREWEHDLLFFGVEDLLPAYRLFAEQQQVPYTFVKKQAGSIRDGWGKVKAYLAQSAPDVVILHSPVLVIPAWQYCRKHKKKLIVVEHTPHEAKSKPETAGSFLSLLVADKIVCLSEVYRQGLRAKFPFLPVLRKTVVIPNGIDLESFKPVGKADNPVIHAGMIGRFSHQKNQALLVEAAVRLSAEGNNQIHFHFAGTGETLDGLREMVNDRGLSNQVHFHGLLDEQGIKDLLARLDIYMHASFAETMCTSVMQAMACGLPVLASNIPGINNITIAGDNALLFANNDIHDFLLKLTSLSEKPVREQMGVAAREYAKIHFSAIETFREYASLCNMPKRNY